MEAELVTAGVGLAADDFSIPSLFMKAGIVVKSVMVVLAAASVWSWAVIIDKSFSYGRIKGQSRKFEDAFWSGKPLDELYKKLSSRGAEHPMGRVFIAAMGEWNKTKSLSHASSDAVILGAKDRIDRSMRVTVERELDRMEGNLGFLATVASSAVFVGLFGTVWGIMNAFQAIAVTKDTNLAVVAPGIAEALFATALGLIAAIPANVAYNRFSTAVNSYAVRLNGFSDEFSSILSRQLDERAK
ncbi:MAG: protein TolQ [Pseudomonadota bacterium]